MPNAPISGLPIAAALAAADPFPTVQGGVTVQASLQQIEDYEIPRLSPFPGYRSGSVRYYNNTPRFAAGIVTITHTIDVIHYSPMYIRRPVTVDRFFLQTGSTNAVAGSTNVGIYSSTNAAPDQLLFNVAVAAIPATANTAVIFAPTAVTLNLGPGFYWYAAQPSATFNMAGAAQTGYNSFDFGTQNTAALFANTSQVSGYTETVAFGLGLPATAAGVISTNSVVSGGFRVQ